MPRAVANGVQARVVTVPMAYCAIRLVVLHRCGVVLRWLIVQPWRSNVQPWAVGRGGGTAARGGGAQRTVD
jgi:hypothetical protein